MDEKLKGLDAILHKMKKKKKPKKKRKRKSSHDVEIDALFELSPEKKHIKTHTKADDKTHAKAPLSKTLVNTYLTHCVDLGNKGTLGKIPKAFQGKFYTYWARYPDKMISSDAGDILCKYTLWLKQEKWLK